MGADIGKTALPRTNKINKKNLKNKKSLDESMGSQTSQRKPVIDKMRSDTPYNPNYDGYYNDVLPVINDAIFKIPKDIIIKVIFVILGIIASIIYLIYNL